MFDGRTVRGSPSNLDFAIYKGIPDRNLFMESRLDLSSTHLPLIAFLQHDVVYLRNRDADRSFQSPGDIDDGIDHLNQCIEVISADFQNRDPVSINPLSRIFPLSEPVDIPDHFSFSLEEVSFRDQAHKAQEIAWY
ncbi:hypothetical protein ACLKA7_005004 [Drosophila subpalustris]